MLLSNELKTILEKEYQALKKDFVYDDITDHLPWKYLDILYESADEMGLHLEDLSSLLALEFFRMRNYEALSRLPINDLLLLENPPIEDKYFRILNQSEAVTLYGIKVTQKEVFVSNETINWNLIQDEIMKPFYGENYERVSRNWWCSCAKECDGIDFYQSFLTLNHNIGFLDKKVKAQKLKLAGLSLAETAFIARYVK